jgi:hypothetical protein
LETTGIAALFRGFPKVRKRRSGPKDAVYGRTLVKIFRLLTIYIYIDQIVCQKILEHGTGSSTFLIYWKYLNVARVKNDQKVSNNKTRFYQKAAGGTKIPAEAGHECLDG